MNAPRDLAQAVSLYPGSLDVIGDPTRGVISILLDTNDVSLTDVCLTVDLAHILCAKLAHRLMANSG